MATASGRADTPLIKVLFEEVYRFDFFQAVRLLERIYPDRSPVGRVGDPSREVVRFRTRVSLNFPASQLYKIAAPATEDADQPLQLMVAFMGLTGPLGVLPHPYTELLVERTRYQDNTLWEFLDLFNHRLVSLFYRAWEKYRFAVAYERGGENQFTEYLFNMIGLGTRGLRNRLGVEDEGLLFYSGLIAQRPHSAAAMEATLGDYFGVAARVAQFSGQWLKLDEENLFRLGSTNNELGISAIAGKRVWDDQSKFRLKFGPLTFQQFLAFLPVGSAFLPVAKITRLIAGQDLDFDLQLILAAKEVPGCVLTTRAKRRPMLGWTTWLKTRPFDNDDPQVVLSVKNE
jgi:type VI secretion system protein ImpH